MKVPPPRETREPVFITGGRRTGTTLLYGIVTAGAASVPMLPEGQTLTRLLEGLSWALDNWEVNTKYYFATREEVHDFFKEPMLAFVRRLEKRFGPGRTVVLKNPEYSFHLKHLERLFPSALFLIAVRDPRDQVTSEYETGLRQIDEGLHNPAARRRDMGEIAAQYRTYYSNFLPRDETPSRRRLYVRYEDLVQRTGPTVERIARFTGLGAAGEGGLAPWSNRRLDFEDLRALPSYSELYGRDVSASRVGRFREVLTAAEVSTVERVCRDLMLAFSYSKA